MSIKWSLCFIALIFIAGCGEPKRDTVTKATSTLGDKVPTQIALNWYPEVEHGGYLAANTLGLFDAADVDVEIIPGGPGAPQGVIQELAAERIQFAVSDADNVVKARAAGVPIVALMAPLQNNPRCIMVHEASGITKLEELANVELAISDSRPFALWMKKKLPLTNVRMVPFNGLVGEFLVKPDFAQQGYVFSEPFVAPKKREGILKVLMVSDIGFNPYASVLVTTETVIKQRPDLVQAVVSASVKGWEQYLADPAKTNEAIHGMNKDMSPEALKYGVEAMAPLCKTDEGASACGMSLERWQTLVQQIEELEDIPKGSVKPEECFNVTFLPPAQK
ncbi:MAG: ABC transporter substrate-binding protein [Planctomycetaceae bacterium]